MNLQDYTTSCLTNYLINLTSEPVSVYEESTGTIKTYFPQHVPLPPFRPQIDENGRKFHYIVSKEDLKRAKREKRPFSDLVAVHGTGRGRGNKIVSSLYSVEDPKLKVRVVLSLVP